MELFSHEDFLNMQLSGLVNTNDKSPNSFSYDILSAASVAEVELQRRINLLYLMFDVDNLHGIDLERRVFQMAGIVRKDATRAYGKVKVRGVPGSFIPEGAVFLSSNGNKYFSFYNHEIEKNGEVDVTIYAYKYGSKSNTPIHSINKLEKAISGIEEIDNIFEISNGYDSETDYELRERYYWKIQNPPKAGNPDHYKLWAEEVDGIGYAKVFRTWKGPSTVKVVIIGSDHKGVDKDMITKVHNYIMKEAPIHWENLTVTSAKEVLINLTAKIELKGGYSIEEVKKNIKDKVEVYLSDVAFKKSFISYAKVAQAVLDADGVADFDDLRINGTGDNIDLEDEEVGIVGSIEVS